MNEHIWIAHHLTMIAVYAERHELRDVPEVIYKAAGAVSRAIRSAGRLAHHSSEDRADIDFMRLQRTHVKLAVSSRFVQQSPCAIFSRDFASLGKSLSTSSLAPMMPRNSTGTVTRIFHFPRVCWTYFLLAP